MSGRITAGERFRRIVSIVPWIAERDGPTVDEICARFEISRTDLLDDLDVVFMVGIPPYTPDELIDVIIEDDRVWITLGRYFTKPLRLTSQEALAVLAAGTGLLATSGSDPDGPLARALQKLQRAAGLEDSGSLGVSLGGIDADRLELLQAATSQHLQVEIDHYSYGSDLNQVRRIDPYRVYATEGNWYVIGWCHLAGAERVFRVDRIRAATLTDVRFDPPTEVPDATSYAGSPTDRRVMIEVSDRAAWITDQYPVESAEDLGDGRLRIVLAVGGDAWLERLLLRLGTVARVVDPVLDGVDPSNGPLMSRADVDQIMASIGRRMLDLYR